MVRLHELEFDRLETLLLELGGVSAQAPEVWNWLYQRRATEIAHMTTLEPELRERLASRASLYIPPVLARQESAEGETRKDLLQLGDGETVEVVLLRYRERRSGCISTQVGCACGCVFCATGQLGFVRHLSAEEILIQVLHLQRELANVREQLSNIVLMGMGEPLLNYEPTLQALRRLVDSRAVGFAQRRITLSTVGIPEGIERFSTEGLQVGLAISLHAATDELRDELVPINRSYALDDLFAAIRVYLGRTEQRVMLEWVMINGVNDTGEQADRLVERLEGLAAHDQLHVNLIRLNPTPGYAGQGSSLAAIESFRSTLDRAGISHTLRQRRGQDISAGCGQLAQRARSAG
jgi:23S rRNA (adenine2503-C2)-methyltransferase